MARTLVDILGLRRGNLSAKTGPDVFSANNIPANWLIGTSYAQYNVVEHSGAIYRSKIAGNLGNQPDLSPSQWEVMFYGVADGDVCITANGSSSDMRMRISGNWVRLTTGLVGSVTNSMFHWDGVSFSENIGMLLDGYEIRGFDDTIADANQATQVRIGGSDKTAGTGDGGDLLLDGGTSAGGFAGKVRLGGYGVVIEAALSSDPAAPQSEAGQVYYNTTSQRFRYYNGTLWQDLGSGSGGGSDGHNLIDVLAQEETNTLPAVDPYLILDDFNEVRGTLVNTERSNSKLQLQTGQTSGTYVRQREVTSSVAGVNGIARVSPTACAPANVAVFSNTFTIPGDVTDLFVATTPLIIAKQVTTDGLDSYVAVTGLDGKVALLTVASATYSAGPNTTQIVINNPDALTLDMGIAAVDYRTYLRIVPLDIQFEASGTSIPSYETMAIDDLSMWSPKTLGNQAESTAAIVTAAYGGPVIRQNGDMSDNGTYGLKAVLVYDGGTSLPIWKFAYTKDGGATWSLLAFTDAYGFTAAYSGYEITLVGYIGAMVQVADNGKAFVAYQHYDSTYNFHVKGSYIDLSAGSPSMSVSAATGVDADNSVGTAGFIAANITVNRIISALAADRADLSFIALCTVAQNGGAGDIGRAFFRFFTNGGATYMGSDLASLKHQYGTRVGAIVVGTSGSHRAHFFTKNMTTNFNHRYYDEPSATVVGTSVVLTGDYYLYDARQAAGKGYVLVRDASDESAKYVTFNTTGSPSFSSTKVLHSALNMDQLFGLGAFENSPSEAYNSSKRQGPSIAINPADNDQVFFAVDYLHPDSRIRPMVFEVRDDAAFTGVTIAQSTDNSGYALRNAVGRQKIAQTFLASGTRIRSITLRAQGYSATSVPLASGTTLTASIYNTTAGVPTTLLATSSTIYDPSLLPFDSAALAANRCAISFNFDTQTLTGTYAIVLESNIAINGVSDIRFGGDSGGGYASGSLYEFDGSTWNISSGNDLTFEISGEWAYDLDRLRSEKASTCRPMVINSTESSIAWSSVASAPVYMARVSAEVYDPNRARTTGQPFKTVFTPGTGSTAASVFAAPVYVGFNNHDKNLVFSTECGADSSARINVNTNVISTTEKAEDRSGLDIATSAYTSVTFGNQALFTSGKSVAFTGTSSKITYDTTDGANVGHKSALALIQDGSAFAIEAEFLLWTLPSVLGRLSIIVSKYNDGTSDPGWLLFVNTNNRIVLGKAGGTFTNTEGSTVLATGTRYVVTATGDGTTVKLYINGVEESYITQNTTAYNIGEFNAHLLTLGNVYNTNVYDLRGELGYVKMIKGSDTFAGAGFADQAGLAFVENLTHGFIAQRHIGQNGNDGVDYDQSVFNSFSGGAAVVDSYDMLLTFNHTLLSPGNFLGTRISMNRVSNRDKISVPGFNLRYSKTGQGSGGGGSSSSLFDYYSAIVGSPSDVSNGLATHTSINSAIAAVASEGNILVRKGTYTESVVINKPVSIEGQGHGTFINGTTTFTSASLYSVVENLRLGGNVTFQASSKGNWLTDSWIIAGGTVTDSGIDNTFDIVEES